MGCAALRASRDLGCPACRVPHGSSFQESSYRPPGNRNKSNESGTTLRTKHGIRSPFLTAVLTKPALTGRYANSGRNSTTRWSREGIVRHFGPQSAEIADDCVAMSQRTTWQKEKGKLPRVKIRCVHRFLCAALTTERRLTERLKPPTRPPYEEH